MHTVGLFFITDTRRIDETLCILDLAGDACTLQWKSRYRSEVSRKRQAFLTFCVFHTKGIGGYDTNVLRSVPVVATVTQFLSLAV